MEPLRYKPFAYWVLDDTAPFFDYGGYDRDGTFTGTARKAIALVPHAQYSQVFKNGAIGKFESNVYQPGREKEPFSIMATVTPVHAGDNGQDQTIQILSNATQYDGLTIEGTIVSFSTKYVTHGEAKCSYDIQFLQKMDIIGVHTNNKNMLFVNGKMVAEVGISADQIRDTYVASDGFLYSGTTLNVGSIMINGVAIYNSALQTLDAERIFNYNNRRAGGDVSRSFGGESILVSNAVRPPFLEVTYTENEDWEQGQLKNCSARNGRLYADMHDGLSIKGTWLNSLDLYRGSDPVALDSVNLMWTGANVSVEASVDTVNWVDVARGSNISVIPPGFDPEDKALYLKVTFTEGEDESYIDNLRVAGYLNGTVTPPAGRQIQWTNPACCFPERPALELREDWGTALTAGRLTIGADISGDVLNAHTIEVWMKKDSATTPTLSFTPDTTYINGNTTTTPARGEWALYHFVMATAPAWFYFQGNVTIGKIAIYEAQLNAAQSLAIYNNHKGIGFATFDDGADLEVDVSTEAVIYSHDWEIVAS